MKMFSKLIFNFFLVLGQSFISCLSVLLFSSFRLNKLAIDNKQNTKEKCFILANGPSLRRELKENQHFFIENNNKLICVNFFCEDPHFTKLQPASYLIADEAFWINTSEENILDIQRRFLSKMKLVNWQMNLILPYEAKKFFQKNLLNNFIRFIYYNRTPVNGFTWLRYYLYEKNLGMPAPHNVLNAALMVSINLGHSEIDIYGADHSWISDLFVDDNNELCCYQNHFYDERTEIIKLEKGSLYKGLQGIVLAYQSYELINDYANYKNVRIVNRTKKSFLDIFNFE